MIKEDLKPEETYTEHINYDGKELEIKGEIFDEPIVSNENIKCYVRITIFDTDTNKPWGRGRINLEDATVPKLVEVVKAIKSHIHKYK